MASALTVMQRDNPNLRFALVNDSSILPKHIVQGAISPIIIVTHPILEDFQAKLENVVVTHREDGVTINEEQTISNLFTLFRRHRVDFIDVQNV